MRNKVRVAIAGVGNCASALVQGTLYYDRLHHSGFHNVGTSGSNDRLHYNRHVEKGRQASSDLKRGNEISNKVRVSKSSNVDLAADVNSSAKVNANVNATTTTDKDTITDAHRDRDRDRDRDGSNS